MFYGKLDYSKAGSIFPFVAKCYEKQNTESTNRSRHLKLYILLPFL